MKRIILKIEGKESREYLYETGVIHSETSICEGDECFTAQEQHKYDDEERPIEAFSDDYSITLEEMIEKGYSFSIQQLIEIDV